ncbi:MAG: hypothetical protein HYS06_03745 [Methylocystis sp.]|nr:hypothetical protein [Methylocystis sp.]
MLAGVRRHPLERHILRGIETAPEAKISLDEEIRLHPLGAIRARIAASPAADVPQRGHLMKIEDDSSFAR